MGLPQSYSLHGRVPMRQASDKYFKCGSAGIGMYVQRNVIVSLYTLFGARAKSGLGGTAWRLRTPGLVCKKSLSGASGMRSAREASAKHVTSGGVRVGQYLIHDIENAYRVQYRGQ